MPEFIRGMELSEGFFWEEAKPILDRDFPGVPYTAGFLGYGSDVLGYDDYVSTDHMWGPRFYLFLREEDYEKRDEMMAAFSRCLPRTYRGYSVHFGEADGDGVRHMEEGESDALSPLIFIETVRNYTRNYLGYFPCDALKNREWLSISEHRLLTFTAGKLFVDDLGLAGIRESLAFYPPAVKTYLVASQWNIVAEEQAFCRRCADRGDDIGSVLVASRIAERLMRLCFLYCDRYAPYSKWFGTAFAGLPIPEAIGEEIRLLMAAGNAKEREEHLVRAQCLVAGLHNHVGFSSPLDIQVRSYYGRDIQVLFADEFAQQIARDLKGSDLEGVPLFGGISQVANLTCLWEGTGHQAAFCGLYEAE